jgi:uncharacterized protein YbjT (DUF2867 family)
MATTSSPSSRTAAPRGRSAARTALLAGATGLIGRELLPLLQARYAQTHVLVRRQPAVATADARSTLHVVDFAQLPGLPAVDDCYIALGTTIKVAGSQAAFRAVDFDYVVNTARAARAAGATRLAVVSALGADTGSAVFYNRVKGEMQAAIAALGFESVVIAQPSLLLGDRAAIGQPVRTGEVWAARLLAPAMGLVPRSIRPIAAAKVASAMLAAMLDPQPGVRVLSSAQMQG